VCIQVIMVGLVIAFPQMVMVYKDDPAKQGPKIELNLPAADANAPATDDKKADESADNSDLMKALGGQSSEAKDDAAKADAAKSEAAADEIMKSFGKQEPPAKADGKAESSPTKDKEKAEKANSKSAPAKGKTKEELAAEEIEKALRGGK
jgi:hypothetical protein